MNDDLPRVRRGAGEANEAQQAYRPLTRGRRAEPLVFQRLQLMQKLRAVFAELQRAGLTWEQILSSLGGALGLLGELGIDLPNRDALANLLDAARQFAAATGVSEAAMQTRLHATIQGAHWLAALTPGEADDELVEVISNFASDDRVERVLVYVLAQIWEEQQAPSGTLALRTPVDYQAKLAFAARTGLLRGQGLAKLRDALPQIVKLFEEFSQLAKLFGGLTPG